MFLSFLLFFLFGPPHCTNGLPNIIMMLGDDSGWYNFGWHSPDIHTPHMNALLKEGVEIDQHYTFKFCSPTRSALLTGRLPIHVNQRNNAEWGWDAAPVDVRMTMLPAKLKQAGYMTHQLGKWHLGLGSHNFTPSHRGFDTSLGYLSGGEHHYTHKTGVSHPHNKKQRASRVDFWDTNQPASPQYDGVFGTYVYTHHLQNILNTAADTQQPFFIYMAYQVSHAPEQAPQHFTDMYPSGWVADRRVYDGMISIMDESVGNITKELKQQGLWNNTLVVFASDNGGPSRVHGPSFANNYPLRGGKANDFQGGVRTAAFVTGGFLPPHVRGTTVDGYIHVCDWYATFCHLAGVDPQDNHPGVPSIDSLNMWPLLTAENTTSPRFEIPLDWTPVGNSSSVDAALIQGNMKLVLGTQQGTGLWWGPQYPNKTQKVPANNPGCPDGCLFNIKHDPSEYIDLSKDPQHVNRFRDMKKRMQEISKTVFQSDANGKYEPEAADKAAVHKYGGRWGPWLD